MKSTDQQLLEEAYNKILNEKQLRLLEEGKITDFLKKLGKGATNTFLKAKNILNTNPRLKNLSLRAGVVLAALAAGNVAEAAQAGSDFAIELANEITQAAANGELTNSIIEGIVKKVEQKYQNPSSASDIGVDANQANISSQSADALGSQAVDQSADKVSNIKQAFSNAKDIDSLYQGINSMAGADKITDIVSRYDVELRNLSRPSSLEEIARDISSEAQYRNFSVDQVKKILSTIDTSVLSPKLNLQKLISLIK